MVKKTDAEYLKEAEKAMRKVAGGGYDPNRKTIYNCCGCDACHWEAYDFGLFYFYKDWDVENPHWVLKFRINE
jgi:hypothetical protein